jgi:DNA primase (bacterial type)
MKIPQRSQGVSSGWNKSQGTPTPGDVLACLEELGVDVARIIHEEAWALCPGHFDRVGKYNTRPNKWSVNIETGQHSCFSCGFSGSFVYLVQEVKGYDRHDAEQWVRSRGGIERLRRILADSKGRTSDLERDEGVPAWNEARLALFNAPPYSALDGRRVSSGAVSHYGVLWDSKKENWILPIRDPDTGSLWGYQEKGEGWFCNKPARVPKGNSLFGIEALNGSTAVLLESPLDCLRLYTAGISGGVSSFGVGVTERQLDLLFDRAEIVIFALDNDEAGLNKMRELRSRYLRSGKRIKFADYTHIPWAKDLGTEGVTDKDIQKAILKAKSLLNFRP